MEPYTWLSFVSQKNEYKQLKFANEDYIYCF